MSREHPRAAGTGYIGQMKDGRWRGSLPLYDGRRKNFYARTYEAAAERMENLLRSRNAGASIRLRSTHARNEGSVSKRPSRKSKEGYDGWRTRVVINGHENAFYGKTKGDALRKLATFLGPNHLPFWLQQELKTWERIERQSQILAQKEHLPMLLAQSQEQLLEARFILKRVQNGSDEQLSAQGFFKKHPTLAD